MQHDPLRPLVSNATPAPEVLPLRRIRGLVVGGVSLATMLFALALVLVRTAG